MATAAVVRSMLGISPSAWEAARTVMWEIPSRIVVAAIQRAGRRPDPYECDPYNPAALVRLTPNRSRLRL